MITCKLYGGMGNQMCQIAATIGLAEKHNVPFFIPNETINIHKWDTYFHNIPRLDSLVRNALQMTVHHIKVYKEPHHGYQEIPYDGEDLCLDGHFQSEKYFLHCREKIIKTFKYSSNMMDGVVAIHVRRGDYLKLPAEHVVPSLEYLTNAIIFFIEKGYKKFMVFSDGMDWCKPRLNSFAFAGCEFIFRENYTPEEDMQTMSQCEHNIISPSSFGAWGAWLNENPNKIVIAPKILCGHANAHLPKADLLPESWIRM